MFYRAVWFSSVQINVGVRIGPLKASDHAGHSSWARQVILGSRVVGENRYSNEGKTGQQEKCTGTHDAISLPASYEPRAKSVKFQRYL